MKIKNLQMKKALRTVLFVLLLCAAGMTKAQTENITFADANVKAICVANWDTDGDGELNQTEAAAVTSLDGVFMFDGEITSFNELQFFTGLTSFGEDEFNSCTSLASISIPSDVTSIGNYAFSDCSSLTTLTSYACTPPILGNEVFYDVPSILVLNVPCHTSAMYQEADGWSNFSNYEEFEYGLCPIPFADATVKAICVAHWDTNEDGELSYAEAAAVTNLGTYFKSTAIISFDELEYFTSLTSLPNTAFYGCTSLASIALPSSVSALGNGSFYNCTNLATMTVYAETPPTVGTNAFKNVPTTMVVHVPCGTIEAYKNANGWSEFTNIQQSGLCPIVFADANVKALCVANWDTNGDGELSYDEAAAVTDLGQVFRYKSTITSFDELQYFINLTSIGYEAFSNCSSLTSVEIPSSVTSIGNYAFYYCPGLTSIEIPNSVTSIEQYAFYHCTGLTSIEIPNSVTSIEQYAFSNCSGLTTIGIPNSVISIGQYAFYYCTSLTSIEIPNSVTSLGTNPFGGCSGLSQIIVDSGNTVYDSRNNCNAIIRTSNNSLVTGCKNTVIPNSVTTIGGYAFYYCTSLTSIEIPNSLTSIGNYAFCNTGLTSVVIPNSVTYLASGAFYYCRGLRFINILRETPPTLSNDTFNYVYTYIPVYVPCSAVEAYQTANGWNRFTNIIGMCSGEVSVMINPSEGGTVSGAGNYVGGDICVLTATSNPGFGFGNWRENGIVVSVDSVYSFYAHPTTLVANFYSNDPIAFVDANVKALCVTNWDTNGDGELSYTEAAAVSDLGSVFYRKNITSFNELQYFTGLNSIGVQAFEDCYYLNSISIPNTVISIEGGAFRFCRGLSTIEIPNSVTSIGSQAFYGCYNLTTIEIPSSVTYIAVEQALNAFAYCSGLEQIIVDPGNVIYDSRENCNAIIHTGTNKLVIGCKNTVIPNSVTIIGDQSFGGCSTLTSIEIPNSVVSIESNAFGYCTGLTTITIPNSVTYIGGSAFNYCIGLTSLTVLANNPPVTVYGSAFPSVNKTIPVYVPCASMLAYQNTSGWNEFTNYMPATECESGEITITANPTEGGTVTGAGYYEGGDNCTLTATANEGYSFVNWTKDGVVVSNSDTFSFFVGGDATYVAHFAQGDVIIFADTNVKAICVANWDTDGDGELSYAEAAAVTNLGQVFRNNSTITSFDELQYFTGLTSIGEGAFDHCSSLTTVTIPNSVTSIIQMAFYFCSGLTSITIPQSVTSIGTYAFYGCNSITFMIIYANNPPILGNSVFTINRSIPVYVPCDALNAYQNANGWSVFTNIIGMCPGTITVVASPAEGGIVNGGGDYEYGDTCTLTAIANHDYHFINWTENSEVVSSDVEYTFLVTGDRNLVANFSFTPPAPVAAEYYPDPNEPNSPYVKVHWAASLFEAQIGEGTSTFGYFPFYTLYNYSISENLFLASELEEASVNTAPMTSLSWYATNAPGYAQQGISIWMANVSDTELTTTSHTVNGMTLVYTGTVTPKIGWNEFVFNEGNFAWDGVSNVLIYCQRNNGVWNSTVYWQATPNLPFNASSYKYQDAGAYNPNVAQSMTISTTRPNIIMKGEGSMTYNLYRANCDGSDAQLIAENVNHSQYIDETWWQLENGSYKYGLSVADSTNTDIFWSNCIEKQGDVAVQTIALSQGWNWVSLSIEAGDPVELLQMLETALVDNAVQIQSFDDNTEFDGEEWFGGLDDTGISNEQMYMIEVVNDCTVELQGTPANPADYEIYIEPEQWTWIGYPCAVEQDIAAALADFEPEEGDQIQAGNIMTEFDGEEWFGDFETLVPGQGYMYFSNSSEPKILVFSTTAKGKSVFLRKEKN